MEELRKLARFLCDLQWEQLPKAVKDSSKMCSLDSIGVAIGALNNEQVQKVSEMYLEVCGPREDVEIWGTDRKAPLLTACFINGMMGHTLELDDVHTDSKTHIGTVVVPAAWAMARYFAHLLVEMLKAGLVVMRLIYVRPKSIQPKLVWFRTPLETDRYKALLSDSITLTAGTITVLAEDGRMLVHALDAPLAEGIEDSSFQQRLERMEASQWSK